LGRYARSHPSRALCTMSRVGQPRTQPERRHHRQSKRQERRKRGAWIDPHGYDAGKKIKGKKRHILVDTQGLLLHVLVALCRRRLSGADLSVCPSQNPPANRPGDRQALRYRKGLCGLAQAMDRRTHHRVAQPLPPLGQGLGVPQPKGLGILAPRLYPPHAEKALSKKSMIPDRLSDYAGVEVAERSRATEPAETVATDRVRCSFSAFTNLVW
jgi:hypothetical protein